MSKNLTQRSAALCLSVAVTLTLLGSVAQLFQREETRAGMALNLQRAAQTHKA